MRRPPCPSTVPRLRRSFGLQTESTPVPTPFRKETKGTFRKGRDRPNRGLLQTLNLDRAIGKGGRHRWAFLCERSGTKDDAVVDGIGVDSTGDGPQRPIPLSRRDPPPKPLCLVVGPPSSSAHVHIPPFPNRLAPCFSPSLDPSPQRPGGPVTPCASRVFRVQAFRSVPIKPSGSIGTLRRLGFRWTTTMAADSHVTQRRNNVHVLRTRTVRAAIRRTRGDAEETERTRGVRKVCEARGKRSGG